jgi:hypothetical protein
MEKGNVYKHTVQRVLTALLLVALLVPLAACNSGGGTVYQSTGAADVGSGSGSSSRFESELPVSSADYSESEKGSDDLAFETAGGAAGNTNQTVTDGRKITYWAEITINTKDFGTDYQNINKMVSVAGGYISFENMRDNSYYDSTQGRYTSMTVEVPASGYRGFLDELSGIGEVTSINRYSEDLSYTYFDTEARIAVLEIRRDRLLNYLLVAEKAEDIIAYERELASVLDQLDRYQSDKRQLDQLVEYSSIDITLVERITPETIGRDGEPLGDRASSAFSMSLKKVRRFLEDTVVFVAGAIPVVFVLAVFALIGWLLLVMAGKALRAYQNSPSAQARQKRRNDEKQKQAEAAMRSQLAGQNQQVAQAGYQQAAPPQDKPVTTENPPTSKQ